MIADATHVRSTGNLPDSLGDAVVAPHLRQAGRRLKRWVGETNYGTAETEAAGLGTPRDFSGATTLTQALAEAEAYLAIAEGLPSWNIVMQSAGGNAAGIMVEGNVGESSTFRYMRADEIAKLQELYLRRAENAAQDYITDELAGGSPGPEISYALDGEGVEIDVDYPE